MIPLILSQTAPSYDLPPAEARFCATWQRHNPDFDYRLFDDAASRDVIADVFPQYLSQYDALPYPVMKADIFRYAVVYRDGGFYADTDMECLQPLPKAFFDVDCLLAVEAHLSARSQQKLRYRTPVQIANCIFGARPRHPVFAALVHRAFAQIAAAKIITVADIEELTGPRMLTRAFYAGAQTGVWKDVSVARQITLMVPLHYPVVWPLRTNMFARHHTHGSWKTDTARPSLWHRWVAQNRWITPFPAGYFHAGPDVGPPCVTSPQ